MDAVRLSQPDHTGDHGRMTLGKNRQTPVTFSTAEVNAIKTAVAVSPPGQIPCPRCETLLSFDRDLEGGTALRCSECKRTCIVRRDLRD